MQIFPEPEMSREGFLAQPFGEGQDQAEMPQKSPVFGIFNGANTALDTSENEELSKFRPNHGISQQTVNIL